MDEAQLLADLIPLVTQAGTLAKSRKTGTRFELKPDGSIVTPADRETEAFLRPRLLELAPNSAVFGEESGLDNPDAQAIWYVDPIDGTSNYAFGQPFWGVSAGLVVQGRIVLGVIDLPELDMTLSTRQGGGASLNGNPLPPIETGRIMPHNLVGYSDPYAYDFTPYAVPGKMRHIGSFVVEALLVATGGLRGLVSGGPRLWDVAAGVLACRELGAEVRELANGKTWDESEHLHGGKTRPFAIVPPDSGVRFGG